MLLEVDRHQAVELADIERRLARGGQRNVHLLAAVQVGDDAARQRQRVMVVLRQMIDDAGLARMQVAAAEILGAYHLAGRRLHQRRPPRKMVPWFLTMMLSSDIAGT